MNKAIYLIGGPGSGKDFLLDSILNDESLTEISLDRLVKAVIKNTTITEINNHKSLIINGSAEDVHNVIISKKILEALDYETLMLYVYTTNEESKLRNDERIKSGRNTISESVRVKKYNTCVANMKIFSEEFERFYLFNNSNDIDFTSEEDKHQITVWLEELRMCVTQHLHGKDINQLFEDTFKTDEADNEKDNDDDETDDDNDDERKNSSISKPKKSVTSKPTNESRKLAGKKLHMYKTALAPESNYDDVRMGVVPSGGIGFTSVNAEGRTFADLRKLTTEAKKKGRDSLMRNSTGKYDLGMHHMCSCGHTLGEHGDPAVPAHRRACMADEGCSCNGFKKAKPNKE